MAKRKQDPEENEKINGGRRVVRKSPARMRAPNGDQSSDRRRKPRRAAAPSIPLAQRSDISSTSSSRIPEAAQPVQSPAETRGMDPQPSQYIDRGLAVPDDYGLDRLVALTRDPQWVYCYWELHGTRMQEVISARGQSFVDSCAWVLRLYRLDEGVAVDMEIEPAIGPIFLNTL